MELLLELFLTMVLSVLIAFLLGKIVSVASDDGDVPDARVPAEGAVAPFTPGLHSSEVAAPASPVVFSRKVVGEAEAIGEIGVGSRAEARELASACGGDCIETEEDRRVEEIARREKGDLAVVGVAVESEEARVEGLGLEEAHGGEKIPDASVEEAEENLASETVEEIGEVVRGLATEEKLILAKDVGQVVNVTLSLDEEKEIARELDTGEVGTESEKDGERLAMVETDDVKVFPYGMAMEIGLESGDGGPETSVKNEKVGSLFNEDDDWEGIEKSDLERLFAAATAFVGSNEGSEALTKLSNDLQMQLYGLHKIATEGPCYESQPMSLKVSARAKWYH